MAVKFLNFYQNKMRKSILNIAKPVNNQLVKIHDLANLLVDKNSRGISNFSTWLFETEEILKKNNLPQIAHLSVIRAQLMNFIPSNKANKRKEIFNNASVLLAEAQDALWNTNSINNQKIEAVTELINQLLIIIYQMKVFKFKKGQNFSHFIEGIWNFCNQQEQLKNLTTQIISQVCKADVFQIMAEKIDLNELIES